MGTKNSKIGWKFEQSGSGDVEGLNDGGVETFRDDHLLSLAKESAQNSLDARLDKTKPVTLEFKTFYIDQKDFPDIETFKDMIDLQIKFWQKTKNDKSSEDFFKEAKKLISSKKILCLRISDSNTTGLDGSQDGKNNHLSRWWKLVRSRGVTDNDQLAGGSFGLGKFASFACSKIRTVFYSTVDLKGIESYQGVSVLASHDTKEGERTRGRGYFCNKEDFSCITQQFNIDEDYKRKTPGTDIYIMGFMEDDELEDKIFSSILRSFLLAIHEGNLIFRLNDKTLKKENLKTVMKKYENEIYRPFVPKETIEYYNLLEGNLKSEQFIFSLMEKDDVDLKIAIGPGLSKNIGVFRNNGMMIFDKKGIRSYNDFVGILSLKGDESNAYFRKLENPEHNAWRSERSKDPTKAKEMIRKLFKFIEKNLKDLENKTLPESENIEGINSLPDEEFEDTGEKPLEGLDFKPLRVVESKTKRKINNKIKISVPGGNKGRGNNKIKIPGGGENFSNPGEDENKDALIEIIPKKIKIFQDKNMEYNLIFTVPEKSNSLKCVVLIGGEEEGEAVNIEKARKINQDKQEILKFKKNEINLGMVEKDMPNHVKFKINKDENWALEVGLYENK